MRQELSYFLQLADAVIITDHAHLVLGVNDKYEELTGFEHSQIVGLKAGFLKSKLTPRTTYQQMKAMLADNKPWSGVFINRKKSREIWHSHITITPIVLDEETYLVGVFRDMNQLSEGVYLSESRKSKIQGEILKVLAISCEIRDPAIEEHLTRVQEWTAALLQAFTDESDSKMSGDYKQHIVNASIMHDIGKSGIPEGILYKPGKLTSYERNIVETHPLIGVDILNKISHELDDELMTQELQVARNIIAYHHEKWDGSGYPYGLSGADIPLEAQIVSIVDVYDALTSRRAYKEAWTSEQAVDFLLSQKAVSFNSELVDVFVEQVLG